MGVSRHFLSTIISSTLVDYAHRLAPHALSILDLNLSEAARVELQKYYPKSHCQHLSFSDMEKGQFYQADTSIDLFVANIARTYPLDLKLFFNDVRRVMHPDGIILFATFDSSSLELVKTQVHIDETEIFVDEVTPKQILKKLPNVRYATFKEELFILDETEKIYTYIFVLAPLKMLEPILRLRNLVDAEGAPETLQTKPTDIHEDAEHESAESETEEESDAAEEKEEPETEQEHEESTHESAEVNEPIESRENESDAAAETELVGHEQYETEVAEKDQAEAQEASEKEVADAEDEIEMDHEAEHEADEKEEAEETENEEDEEDEDEIEEESIQEDGIEIKEAEGETHKEHLEKFESHNENAHDAHESHVSHSGHEEAHESVDEFKPAQINKKMETHQQQLETHLHALNQNLNSSAEIIRELRSGRLTQQQQQVKRAALRQHLTQHQTLLNAYQNLQQTHAALLSQFIDAQEHTLRMGAISVKSTVQKHQDVSAKHEEEAKKHEELLETLRL